MMTDRVARLKEKSVNTQPRICMERAVSVTKAYQEYAGSVSPQVMRGIAFKQIMEDKTIYIGDDELIVGERGAEPGATSTFPELCCHTIEDLEVMDARKNVNFTVTEEDKRIQKEIIIPYWKNRSTRYKMFQELDQEWIEAYEAGIFTEFMEQRGPGHTVGDKKLFQKGMLDFKKDIQESIEKLDFFNDPEALDKREALRGMDLACDAMLIQGRRHAEKAREMAVVETDEKRKAELLEIAEICDHVPANAPRNFREAVQMYWFVHLGVVTELNPWDSYNPGRFDQHLYPFYKKEIEEGTLTREEAEEILQCLWVKFNNNPAPPKVGITLKESATYFDFCTINSGGLTTDGEDGVNDVSYLVLDVIREMRMLQPGSNVQISEKTPQDFLKKAIDITRTGYGQPSIFNADAVVQELLYTGKTLEDARDGGTSGCVEVGAFGKEAYILTGYFNLAKILELALNNGFDQYTNKQIGPKTGEPSTFNSYEDIYSAFQKQLAHFIDIKIKGNNIIGRIFEKYMHAPFLSVVTDDCIKNGVDYNSGGARYNTTFIQGVGIANLTDALSSIKYNIYDNNNFTLEELLDAMKDNYEGHDRIFDLVYNRTPKYGNDDEYADAILVDVFNEFLNNVNGRPAARGGQHLIEMLPTTCHVYFGQVMQADPAGRKKELPLADGISPAKGADRNGPTGVIKSASKMDQLKTGGALLNQKFTPQVVEGEKGLDAMASVVRSYFKLDGHHIQFNVVAKETLLDAQKNPDDYKNLIVRVAGYSDYFNNLDKALQDEIISRTEQQV